MKTPAISRGLDVRYHSKTMWIFGKRDRLGIWVADTQTAKIVFEVWDDNAMQLLVMVSLSLGTGSKNLYCI